jgi:hypothetical protein
VDPNSNSQFGSLPSDTGSPYGRAVQGRVNRVLPIRAGASGGMQNTQEATIAQMWMNPTEGAPRPGGLYMGSVTQ